jgi:hypothetical protein
MSEITTNYEKMKVSELVDLHTKWDKIVKDAKVPIEKVKAELQKRGLAYLEDKNLKTVQYKGTKDNFVLVQKTESVDVVNYLIVESILKDVLAGNVEKIEEPKFKLSKNMKQGMSAVFTKSYETRTVEDILKEMGFSPTGIQLAVKKLKGTWLKDKALLESLGCKNDIELYLYFIHQSMNYHKLVDILIATGIDKNEVPLAITKLKKAFIIEENTKVSCHY